VYLCVFFYLLDSFCIALKRTLCLLVYAYVLSLDVYDVGALAGQIGPNALQYQRGIGRKLGESIQFLTTVIGGLIFAFYSSWRAALVILLVFPVVAAGTMATQYYNVTASQRAAKHYERAGGISYAAVSAIKTVLSLNAVPEMIRQYNQATKDAFHQATFFLVKKGFANGKSATLFLQ
jgi:ATP-binding cassette, subfamily B (MDR/TAP), member 1